jgi:hypothetical protein
MKEYEISALRPEERSTGVHNVRDALDWYEQPWLAVHIGMGAAINCETRKLARRELSRLRRHYEYLLRRENEKRRTANKGRCR